MGSRLGILGLACALACVGAPWSSNVPTPSVAAAATNECDEPGALNPNGLPCRRASDGSLRWGPRYRVFYYGDSIGLESARIANMLLADRGAVMVDRAVSGSSPCDWMTYMRWDLDRGAPDAVIAETIGNTMSRCQLSPSGARPQWNSAAYWRRYTADLTRLVEAFPASTGIWLTPPPATRNDRSSGYSHKAKMLSVMATVALGRPNTWANDAGVLIEDRGRYARYLPCMAWEPVCMNKPKRGWNTVRGLDGTHFCPVAIKATIEQLRTCDPNPGAYRFAVAQVSPVLDWLASTR